MNRRLLSLVVAGCLAFPAWAATSTPAPATSKPAGPDKNVAVEVARTVSLVTGVALSPLLGVGAVGAYDYFTTPDDRRRELHWYASPFFWLPALLIVAAIAAKDALGVATPPGLKKPLDVAEVVENKVSGLVAAGAFLPASLGVLSLFSGDGGQGTAAVGLASAGFAAIDLGGVLSVILAPFALVAFVMVWMVSHAINVLILISPFPPVDAGLKAFRAFLLSLVTATSFADPYVGVAFALVLILVCYFLAGWAFRLLVVGGVFSWDFLTRRSRRFLPTTNANWMFLAREVERVPVRTYGRLVRQPDGGLLFEYRPWMVLAKQSLPLPEARYTLGKGLFFSEVHVQRPGEEESRDWFDLPPRYRGHEEDLGRAYGFPVEDVGLRRGLKGAWRWLKGLFVRTRPAESAG